MDGYVVKLRDGYEIETSRSASDLATLMVVFVRQEYAPIPGEGLIVDIGANIGSFSLYAARGGARRVIAYEPSRDAYAVLQRNVQRNRLVGRIAVERLAVAAEAGRHVWFPTASSPANHMLSDDAGREDANPGVEKVATTSLNRIVDVHGAVDLLKIDCEGAEYEIVAATSSKTWDRIRAVRLEYHAGRAADLIATLTGHGFRLLRHTPDPTWPKQIGMLHFDRE